ncbi:MULTISPECIES: hypothetical protein [Pseudoalteromonas]|uniref:Uncharacterized protein n=1 Tax=Pseudoalteromonas amylolytica TaxID=1859457 RepID=A0A1S1MS23_9GAMM|nr:MULTISPECIES: hypothetical protein [Pseudoalteromonas]OHU88075.1 hypothetical protein BFC16_11830 [Pseudoalteromonas sp. JW3]OHU91515.1 hypothetical protein BET10_11950 [Pseudoalteromonas amylolytica]
MYKLAKLFIKAVLLIILGSSIMGIQIYLDFVESDNATYSAFWSFFLIIGSGLLLGLFCLKNHLQTIRAPNAKSKSRIKLRVDFNWYFIGGLSTALAVLSLLGDDEKFDLQVKKFEVHSLLASPETLLKYMYPKASSCKDFNSDPYCASILLDFTNKFVIDAKIKVSAQEPIELTYKPSKAISESLNNDAISKGDALSQVLNYAKDRTNFHTTVLPVLDAYNQAVEKARSWSFISMIKASQTVWLIFALCVAIWRISFTVADYITEIESENKDIIKTIERVLKGSSAGTLIIALIISSASFGMWSISTLLTLIPLVVFGKYLKYTLHDRPTT